MDQYPEDVMARQLEEARECAKQYVATINKLRAEIERLTRERDEARGTTMLHTVITDIREQSGLGAKPMLSELAGEIGRIKRERDEARAALEKTIAWLGKLANQSDQQERQNRGRFNSLADACAADAKNYRATADDLHKALHTHEQETPGVNE